MQPCGLKIDVSKRLSRPQYNWLREFSHHYVRRMAVATLWSRIAATQLQRVYNYDMFLNKNHLPLRISWGNTFQYLARAKMEKMVLNLSITVLTKDELSVLANIMD